jgi:hypothetical protein
MTRTDEQKGREREINLHRDDGEMEVLTIPQRMQVGAENSPFAKAVKSPDTERLVYGGAATGS